MKRIPMQEASNVLALLNTEGWPAEAIDPSKPFKWQTRRVCRKQPGPPTDIPGDHWEWAEVHNGGRIAYRRELAGATTTMNLGKVRYQPGEVLAVGEKLEGNSNMDTHYAADYAEVEDPQERGYIARWAWKHDTLPSRFMPVWAARMWVKVMAVRVEPLLKITPQDAVAEGAFGPAARGLYQGDPNLKIVAILALRDLWERIHGPDSWDENLWVEVYEIMRVERPNGISQG